MGHTARGIGHTAASHHLFVVCEPFRSFSSLHKELGLAVYLEDSPEEVQQGIQVGLC